MATSVLMASERETENNFGPRPENGEQRGRRKLKSAETTQKKKQPQRGMGVAQLERLRLQERFKNMSQFQTLNPYNQYYIPSSYSNFSSYVPINNGGGQLGLNQSANLPFQRLGNSGFLGQVGSSGDGRDFPGQFQENPYGFGESNLSLKYGNVGKTSKELSSIPNMNPNFSDHVGFSNKKKRVNGESQINGSGFLGYNLGCISDQYFGTRNQEFGLKTSSFASYAGGNVDQEAEVMAVHRQARSSMQQEGSVLMEYEFFPAGKSIGSTSSEDHLSVVTSSSSSTATGFDASNSIDLSLKLSF